VDGSEFSTELIKAMFGRKLRVVLAAWILDHDSAFFLQEAQDAMRLHGEAPSGVSSELRKFVKYGMLMETPDQRRVYFSRTESPLWPAFRAIAIAVAEAQRARSEHHADLAAGVP
jgi:hypothetical protein